MQADKASAAAMQAFTLLGLERSAWLKASQCSLPRSRWVYKRKATKEQVQAHPASHLFSIHPEVCWLEIAKCHLQLPGCMCLSRRPCCPIPTKTKGLHVNNWSSTRGSPEKPQHKLTKGRHLWDHYWQQSYREEKEKAKETAASVTQK